MFEPFLAATLVAALSLGGIFIFRNHPHITGTHRFIVPVALGFFLGIVFFELIPETLHHNETYGALAILAGFLGFYWLAHVLRGYHGHQHEHCEDCVPQHSARLILVGDAVHNVTDGVIIAAAFAIDPAVGVAATIGVALHEIPQEIAEFGVLVAAGYSRVQAALYNALSASSILLGVLLTYLVLEAGDYVWILTGLAAGNLLYIAAADMIPELHGEHHRKHFALTFASTLVGLILMYGLVTYTHEHFPHSLSDSHDHAHTADESHAEEDEHSHDEEHAASDAHHETAAQPHDE